TVPNPFKEDTWVSAIEIRPGDPSVVHHVIVQIPEGPDLQDGIAVNAKIAKANQQGATVKPAVLRAAPADFVIPNRQGGGAYSDTFARLEEMRTGKGSFT